MPQKTVTALDNTVANIIISKRKNITLNLNYA